MTATQARASTKQAAQPSPVRLDIQALRAVAVGLVLLNHLWPERLTGGYIGVDVFFVISGYLITAHLVRDANTSGRINLAKFWARRAKRLLPAALVVLSVTVVLTAVWLPLTSQRQSFNQIGAAGAYILNWILAATSMDYFAHDVAQSPVTHYWSLSVEEQFYIVWPLLILAGIGLTRRRSRAVRTAAIIAALAAVFAASLAWGIYSSASTGNAAYFETTGRAWEFAAGGLLAFVPAASARLQLWLIPVAWAAWGAIAFAAWTFDAQSGFPGVLALVPVAATSTLIWIGDIKHSWSPNGITSLGPVQFLGGISYSVYLWHWPLIVVAPFMLDREITAKDKLMILGVTLLLAYLSKRFIEDPVRLSQQPVLSSPRIVLALSAASVLLLLFATIPLANRITSQAMSSAQTMHARAIAPDECFGAQAALSGSTCPDSHQIDDPSTVLATWGVQDDSVANGSVCLQLRGNPDILNCSFGVPEGEQDINVALVGDSHAGMWSTALDAIAGEYGIRVTTFLNSACPVTLDRGIVGASDHIPAHQSACLKWREEVVAVVASSPDIDVVIASNRDRSYSTAEGVPDGGQGYAAAWQTWLDAGKQVIVIKDAPTFADSVPQCIATSGNSGETCTVPRLPSPSPMELAVSQIDSSRLALIDYSNVFCDVTTCYAVIGGIPAYLDTEHLTADFARSFGGDFLSEPLGSSPQ
ncbi:acyltransferase family protein [Microbacterium sp. CJ77]|uniref:acyltransferase family protein n=1 Tax=Microbacterium sp. CJ77 TaxID=2079201 RepID=UPI000CD97598|nr:acyltransferase family protein [Microbacterium sp. CJ77]